MLTKEELSDVVARIYPEGIEEIKAVESRYMTTVKRRRAGDNKGPMVIDRRGLLDMYHEGQYVRCKREKKFFVGKILSINPKSLYAVLEFKFPSNRYKQCYFLMDLLPIDELPEDWKYNTSEGDDLGTLGL